MACFETGTVVTLSDREAVALPDIRGATLRVTQGRVWLTEESDSRDIVLQAGDNWVVEFNGRTVIEAQNDAVFCIVGRKGAVLDFPARPRRTPTSIAGKIAAFFTATPRYVPYA